jgi:Fic family protein
VQNNGQPTLTALSLMIQRTRSDYYRELEIANRKLDIDGWLRWFADKVLAAQQYTLQWLDFVLAKTKLLDRLRGQINARQEKALLRIMRDGPDGFRGGLSASNYVVITGARAATARCDLAQLVDLGALHRTGQLKGTRYWLPFDRIRSASN